MREESSREEEEEKEAKEHSKDAIYVNYRSGAV